MSRAAAAVLLLAAGCSAESWKYKEYPPNPYPDLQSVAVLPIFNQTGKPAFDGEEFGNILASEMLKFPGFRAVRPSALRASGQALPRSVEEALKLGRSLKVDAVLIAAVTDYDPYDPPRVAVSVQFLRTSSRDLGKNDIDRLVQSASWRRGPFEIPRDRAGHWVAAFENVYDAHEERIRTELLAYAQAQEGSDSAFLGEHEFLAVQSRYFQFVSNQVLNHIFEQSAAP
jgi:hypothetical protein